MKKQFTQTIRTLVLIVVSGIISFNANATAWTTAAAGAVNTLSNWTNGTSSPTTFTTPGDTWTVTMSMTLGSGVIWTLGTVSSTPDTLTLATGGTISVGGIPTTPIINIYGVLMMSGGNLTMGGTAASEIVNVYGNTFFNSGSMTTPASSAHLFINSNGNFTMSGGSAGPNGSAASITFNIHGNFSMTGGTINTPAASAYDTVNVHGNFSMTGGTFNTNGAGCYLLTYLYGNCTISGSSAFQNTGAGCYNDIHFSLPSTSGIMLIDNTSTGSWSATNMYIDTDCTAQLDGNFSTTAGGSTYGLTVNGRLICPAAYTINGTDKFLLSSRGTLIVGSPTGINGAILTSGTKTFNDTASYGFNGSAAQVTGSYMPGALYSPDTIIIDNTAGVTLSQTTSTTGTLAFVSGILNTVGYTITVPGTPGSVTGAGATSYVNGTLIKPVTGLTTVNYEVGDLTYAPMSLTLSAAATTGSFALKANNGLHPSAGTSGFSSTHIYNHYWNIMDNFVSGPTTVTPTVTCSLTDILGGSNSYFVTQQYNGAAWLGAPLATTNTSSPYTSAPNSGIALGSLTGDYIFGRVATTLDANTITNAAGSGVQVFPNPNSGTFTVNLQSANNEEVHVVITTVTGEKVKDFITTANKDTVVTIDAPAGIYLLSAYSAGEYHSAKIFVK